MTRSGASENDHQILVIGAGFSGIGTAIRLQQNGFDDFLLLDEADGAGGTWHWNRYPGIGVDIPSFSYQFSFEKRRNWRRTYATGDELQTYAEHCVAKYGLRQKIRFNTQVTRAEFDKSSCHWHVVTAAGDELRARFLINACGVFNRPARPDIDGLDRFAGLTMHTARWESCADLAGQRVGIIGTGASAVQVIPAIAPRVRQLTIFQRTPIWCLPKPDWPLHGVVARLLGVVPGAQALVRAASQVLVELTFVAPAQYGGAIPGLARNSEKLAKLYLRAQVHDPVLRDKLTPRYGFGCKRPGFHNKYWATFNCDNVYLETQAIDSVTENGVRMCDGYEHVLDALILATGFKVMDPNNWLSYELIGMEGQALRTYWSDHRLQAFYGVSVPGFPNHFSIIGPYGYNGSSYFSLIEAQSAHIVRCLKRARALGATCVAIQSQANDQYFEQMIRRRRHQIFWQDSCAQANSYYFDNNGDVPLRPTTTLETAWRSRTFSLNDYTFC